MLADPETLTTLLLFWSLSQLVLKIIWMNGGGRGRRTLYRGL